MAQDIQPKTAPAVQEDFMEKLISLCKRRGFVFPSSEIYGGFAAVYDYGHYGTLLKNNIRDAWLCAMVQYRDDVFALDSGIFMHPKTWVASGHVESFDDPQVDCRKCRARFRADHVLESFGVQADKQTLDFLNAELDKLRATKELVCPGCGSTDLTQAKRFSLMVKSNLGSPTSEWSEEDVVYLRPETCGGIYLEYKNTVDTMHPKLPFGIAQVGKAFRNEIVARQFIFRTREFEQMELQYFIRPETTEQAFDYWQKARWQWYLDNGAKPERLRWHEHEKLAHYASRAFDVEYDFKALGGFKEIEGVHARGDWDLSQHAKFSGQKLDFLDPVGGERLVPHIVETSVGLNRLVFMFLDQAFEEEALEDGETRTVLRLPKHLAPIKVAVLPLSKKPELSEPAFKLAGDLRKKWLVEYDETQSIGKRYRRQDEIGTPFCVTYDFDTLNDQAVTVRERDSMKQDRVPLQELEAYLGTALK
ncbi:MAG: glycine--tRNA ligase [bacterium]